MPKNGRTDSQRYRYEAAHLIMQNVKNERVLTSPWITIDKMAAYLRYGDPNRAMEVDKKK